MLNPSDSGHDKAIQQLQNTVKALREQIKKQCGDDLPTALLVVLSAAAIAAAICGLPTPVPVP